jgi:uncharacterized membrane protein YeaQ/YmgE (transglycosylase-associated protein family)
MSIILTIIVGALIGWIASRLMGRHEGFLGSVAIGIIGSFIGTFISSLTTGSSSSYLSFSLSGFIWSIIGSVIFVAILNALSHNSHSHHTA